MRLEQYISIHCGGLGSGRHAWSVGDRARFGNRLGKITKSHGQGMYSFKTKDGNFKVHEDMLGPPTRGTGEKLPNFGDKRSAMPDSKGRI